MNFEKEKEKALKKKDLSHKGSIDKEIIQLVRLINSFPCYYTTSSCSGRIILFEETGKKHEKAIIFSSHKKISSRKLKEEIEKGKEKTNEEIWLKAEPCIMHVACKTLEDSFFLLRAAREAGWKKSGIISKKICELASTELLAVPIARKNFFFDTKILAEAANKKLENTRKKIKKLFSLLKKEKRKNES